jgi:putative MFS transporter
MFGLGALPLVLLPLVWMTLPESPRWLARRGRMDAANKALAKLGGGPAAASVPAPVAAKAAPAAEKGPGLLALFAPAFAARTLTVTALWFLAMFTSFGLTTWLPSIYVGVFHIPVGRALTYSAINSVILLCFLAAAGTLIDKFGRRTMAMSGLAVTSSTMIALALLQGSPELVLVGLSVCGQLGIFFGAFTLWPYTAEVYPTTVRALALGWSSSIGRGASMLTPILVGWVLNQGASISIVFGIFGGFALLALLLWLTRTRETAGKALDSI